MEKGKNLELPVPLENGLSDPQELPPSYDEAVQSTSSGFGNFFRRYAGRNSRANDTRVEISTWKHEKPLQYYLPDPKYVKCHCGKHVDTTKRSWYLPAGNTRCACGYVVSSTGYSCHASQYKGLALDASKKCGCGEPLPELRDCRSWYTCKCGAIFSSDGSARRVCPYHQTSSDDARNVQCKCGRHVDTTAIWNIRHGTKNLTQGEINGFPWAGYSMYDYKLPAGSARCECGLTVKRDGTSVSEGHMRCCKVLSCKAREAPMESEESCTCVWR